ncbi:hypothetical protein METUNv1_03720 [Methyloversatilis universalis FAM5]|uniref:Uncharacterized protein n=1 Tax=Methyloversatilis universalis (strain ATCC BAA-1314 / DSM 25237 / JCM 13912 / CCUG 52030 / FAM5) TaxID=1000565 RepID=F5RHC3_METUF|nr:hypothetical protein METUNv1_03720 [Methyloversatilis universalis FAM5]
MITLPVFTWIFMRCYDCAFLWREARLSFAGRVLRPALSGICIECGSIETFERGRAAPGPSGTAGASAPPLTNRGGTVQSHPKPRAGTSWRSRHVRFR